VRVGCVGLGVTQALIAAGMGGGVHLAGGVGGSRARSASAGGGGLGGDGVGNGGVGSGVGGGGTGSSGKGGRVMVATQSMPALPRRAPERANSAPARSPAELGSRVSAIGSRRDEIGSRGDEFSSGRGELAAWRARPSTPKLQLGAAYRPSMEPSDAQWWSNLLRAHLAPPAPPTQQPDRTRLPKQHNRCATVRSPACSGHPTMLTSAMSSAPNLGAETPTRRRPATASATVRPRWVNCTRGRMIDPSHGAYEGRWDAGGGWLEPVVG